MPLPLAVAVPELLVLLLLVTLSGVVEGLVGGALRVAPTEALRDAVELEEAAGDAEGDNVDSLLAVPRRPSAPPLPLAAAVHVAVPHKLSLAVLLLLRKELAEKIAVAVVEGEGKGLRLLLEVASREADVELLFVPTPPILGETEALRHNDAELLLVAAAVAEPPRPPPATPLLLLPLALGAAEVLPRADGVALPDPVPVAVAVDGPGGTPVLAVSKSNPLASDAATANKGDVAAAAEVAPPPHPTAALHPPSPR